MTACETLTPAQLEEDRLQLVYDVRDALMQRHAYPEQLATDLAELFVATMAQLEDGELLATKRAIRRRARRERDLKIRAELRPGNASEVAARHGVSVTRAYEIAGAPRRAA